MKRVYLIIAVFIITGNAVAQEAAPRVFTLQECIDYALENAVPAQNAKIDEQIAQAKVRETIGIGLPQIDGAASVQHNQQLRRFFGTYIANPGEGDFTFFPPGIEGAEDGDVLAAQSPFQLKSSGDAGLTINQIIFNGSYVVGLQASKAYKDLAIKSSAQTKEQIIQQVTKAYYAVLINKERSALFTSNIARVDTLLRNTRALFQNGFAESIDADRVQVTLNNLIVEQDKFLSLNELGLELLKFQMNFPMNESLDVQGSIENVQVHVDLEAYKQDWSYNKRPDYQLLEANKRLQELNVRNQYAQSVPSISAFANLGYATQSSNVGGIFKTNSNAKDDGTYGPDKWYPYSLFGVSLNVPIFSGLQRNYRVQQEKLSLQKINNNFINLESSIDLEIKRASVTYENALRTLTAQQQNTELAGKVASVTKIKYEQGIGSNIEVIDAEDSLRQAQTNYYSALFDAMIARVDLEKAYGKLIAKADSK